MQSIVVLGLPVPGLDNTTTALSWCLEPDNITPVDTAGWSLILPTDINGADVDEGQYILDVPLAPYGSSFKVYEIANPANFFIGTLAIGGTVIGAPVIPPGLTYTNPVIWRGKNGMLGMKAVIRRVDDNLYWNETALVWQSTAPSFSSLLSEVSTGVYAGDATFTPGPGVTYEFDIQDSLSASIIKAYLPYSGEKKTALQHVNDVQASLRMPLSADFTSPHAKLVLSQINEAILLMVEGAVWPEMKIQGKFYTTIGKDLYQVRPANTQGIEIMERMQIGTSVPIEIISDSSFRAYKLAGPTPAQPLYARIYGRIGDILLLELTPAPDAVYAIDFDAVLKVATLVNTTDIPLLDDAMVLLGGTAFAKKEQGEAFNDDMNIFNAKVMGQRDSISEPNWGETAQTI